MVEDRPGRAPPMHVGTGSPLAVPGRFGCRLRPGKSAKVRDGRHPPDLGRSTPILWAVVGAGRKVGPRRSSGVASRGPVQPRAGARTGGVFRFLEPTECQ